MSTSRIDELRSKFQENPRRYFAPLANEYRKSGDLVTAIALCREHLPKQPGHMSGHIVFGQALFEAGELEEAQQVFEAALALDPENLIALRHLVDIARANGDSRMSRRWYERILDVDPHNDEIAQQLSSLVTPPVAVAAVPEPLTGLPQGTGSVYPETDAETDAETASVDETSLEASVHAEGQPDEGRAHHGLVDLDEIGGIEVPELVAPVRTADPVNPVVPVDTLDSVGAAPEEVAHSVAAADEAPATSVLPAEPTPIYVTPIDQTEGHPTPLYLTPLYMTPVGEGAIGGEQRDTSDFDVIPSVPDVPGEPEQGARAEDAFDEAFAGVDAELAVTDDTDLVADDLYGDDISGGYRAVDYAADTADLDGDPGLPERTPESTPIDIEEAVQAFSLHDPVLEIDPRFAGTPTAAADVSEPPMLSAVEAELEFEEGLLAPEWPDTSVLAARLATPPEETAVTPAWSQEAVDAFGREVSDPAVEAVVEEIEYGERIDLVVDADEIAAADESVVEPVALAESTAVDESVVDESAVTAESAVLAEDTEEGTATEVEVEAAQVSSVLADADLQLAGDVAAEFADDAVQAAELDPTTEAEVEAVAQALLRDARASGENEAIRVEALDGAGDVVWSRNVEEPLVQHETPLVSAAFEDERPVDEHPADARTADERPADEQLDPDSPAFFTETMGELLVSQGFASRALIVYRELVRRRPYDEVLAARLAELEAAEAPQDEKLHHTPLLVSAVAAEDTEQPTARERFLKLAMRRVPRRTPQAATVAIAPPAEGLATLFGAEASDSPDEYAARLFADAFAPMDEPPVGSHSMATPIVVTRTITAPAIQAVEPAESVRRTPASSFSFDQFFPDPAVAKAQSTPPRPTPGYTVRHTPSSAPPVSDDLAEFAAWLKGLDKQ